LQQLRSDGYVRARIDGEMIELDHPPKLDLRKKHTIEVVIDRLKVRPDVRLRLAESFETALRLADGLALVGFLDEIKPAKAEISFSSKFACSECGYSLPELAPRLFSFNNPVGACSACDGLGVKQDFDPDLVVKMPKLTLEEGAIRGWDKRTSYYFQMLSSLAKHFGFAVDKPFNELPKKIQTIILYGSDELIKFKYKNDDGRGYTKTDVFEGVIPNMERRYRETESEMVREELSKYLAQKKCDVCHGERLCEAARYVFVDDTRLPEIVSRPISQTKLFFENLKLSGYRAEIAEKIQKELISRLNFLVNVGLDYLSLDRSADTLSGGEAQRIRLASQIGAGLVGVMYILDEPSIGLHQRDNERLLSTLHELRDRGNTVIVVEHDEEAILGADYVVDLGPGAGVHGGSIVAMGTPQQVMDNADSITGQYLSGKRKIAIPEKRMKFNPKEVLSLKGAHGNNLRNIDIDIPLGLLTCITGVSGSGKSTLMNDTLGPLAARQLNGATLCEAAPYTDIDGLDKLDKFVDIDQSPIGRTPRSNPATYTGLFTYIRELFAGTQEARSRGYKAGRFSFNVRGGRCEACEGDGVIKVEMHFLADVYVSCDVCQGKRYNRETLEITYKGKNIHQILALTIEDARVFFDAIPSVARKLQTLIDVGLSYVCLGQSATTLSGGEAQRIKLAKELSRRDTGNTLYILDEPTTGLHFSDIEQLLAVLHRLRDAGNTIVIIEHNLDVIKTADWIIDLGPEGGDKGGTVIAKGTPEDVAKVKTSYTARFLKKILMA
jgi:excinuclease ABC subunit A